MKKTEHYQLNQYEPTDSFLRTDFNEDNAKIDGALHQIAQRPECVVGHYQGNDSSTRDIYLGFQPKLMIISSTRGFLDYGGIVIPGYTGADNAVTVTSTGFQVRHVAGNMSANSSSYHYFYLALK